ncbi:hypothetical protein [Streptomyces sp. SM12]|uniref:hypothetical protein n=1 Tax=Streptomyces sp. SM12 TaxID=1071602 RepID=UPI000CD4F73A|nr:hypothetical protein [Streptomyces sp. SM12]
MSAPTHTARSGPTVRRYPAQTRLPWWALLLPAAAFLVLLALPSALSPEPADREQPISHFFDRAQQKLAGS